MEFIYSRWQFRFDPEGADKTLLEFGDWIAYEPRFPMKKGLEVTDIPGGIPFLRGTGSLIYTLKWDVYDTKTTDALAREAILTNLLAIGPLEKKPLRVKIEGRAGAFWDFSAAFIAEHEPAMEVSRGIARLVKSYSITATGLAKVGT